MMIMKPIKNTNVKDALQNKSEIRDLLQSIINGEKSRQDIEEICVSLINEQVKDETSLKGFWMIMKDNFMPKEARVDFIYYPTCYAVMIMIIAYLMNIDSNIPKFKETLNLGLRACAKTNLSGHGYESMEFKIEILDLFIDAGLLEFMKLNYNFCRPFSKMIDRTFNDIKNRLNSNKTKGVWGEDYTIAFKNLLKKQANNQLKLFVYGTLMKGDNNHRFLRNNCVIGDAVASGYTLYDTGHGYPGVKHSLEDKVLGELYVISNDDLNGIDYLESNGLLYDREFTVVTDNKGTKHLALIYVYLHEVSDDKKISAWKIKDENTEYVWYASYGSNLNYNRFMKYINNCSDNSEPIESKPILINHRMYFSKSSSRWEQKGVAFIDADENQDEKTLGRMYLVTREQFEEIKYQEGIWYQNELDLGMYENKKIVTFTDFEVGEENEPSERYVDVIKNGILQIYPNITEEAAKEYLQNHIVESIKR